MRAMRRISWIRAARKTFDAFPSEARLDCETALAIAAEGRKADIAKPMKGMDGGVFEIALAHRGDAFRVIYVFKLDDDLWVIHAFQKKS